MLSPRDPESNEQDLLEVLRPYSQASNALVRIGDRLNLASLINPLNSQSLFSQLSNDKNFKVRLRDFTYEEITVDISSIEKSLSKISISPDVPELQAILENKIIDIRQQLELVKNRGNRDKFLEASVQLYGKPSKHNLNVAMRILISFEPEQHQAIYPPSELKLALEQAFEEMKLKNWIVVLSDTSHQTFVSGRSDCDNGGLVSISSKRLFSQNELLRLPVHEVKVHAVRRDNGLRQYVDIFGTGLRNYINTEEGLALNAEKLTSTSCSTAFRRYAGRTLAVDAMLNDFSFMGIYEMLRDYGIDHTDAFETAKRAARGGGYTKDHVYLDGYKRVKKFIKAGKDLTPLFIGKVGLNDIPTINSLLDKGYLKPANQIPDFFQIAK